MAAQHDAGVGAQALEVGCVCRVATDQHHRRNLPHNITMYLLQQTCTNMYKCYMLHNVVVYNIEIALCQHGNMVACQNPTVLFAFVSHSNSCRQGRVWGKERWGAGGKGGGRHLTGFNQGVGSWGQIPVPSRTICSEARADWGGGHLLAKAVFCPPHAT